MQTRFLVRLVVYGSLVGGVIALGVYCTAMPGESAQGFDSQVTPLRLGRAEKMRADVDALVARSPRNLDSTATLRSAEEYLVGRLHEATGLEVLRERVPTPFGDAFNLLVDVPGHNGAGEFLIVGAHYDTAPGTPGANDNGSGVAILLSLAETMSLRPSAIPVRFILFANEEPPHFQTERMGSLVHAKGLGAGAKDVRAMISLESLGYYTSKPGSQKYPPPIGLLYPDEGNFVAFVSNLENRSLVTRSLAAFRKGVKFPSEGGVFPGKMPGIGWSDHWSFWQVGVPALMMTDTAPFRDAEYHQGGDTSAHLDFQRMTLVAEGAEAVVRRLAE